MMMTIITPDSSFFTVDFGLIASIFVVYILTALHNMFLFIYLFVCLFGMESREISIWTSLCFGSD